MCYEANAVILRVALGLGEEQTLKKRERAAFLTRSVRVARVTRIFARGARDESTAVSWRGVSR